MPDIGPSTRDEALERLGRETFDVCVVGGGITGAGIALDAASRGLSVALIERDDWASGTSSRSSKMVHGGLRYLANYEFGLSWEAVRERDLLRRLAPHLVRPVLFLYPVFRTREARLAPIGLGIYDVMSGGRGFRRHRRARRGELAELAPRLDTARLKGAWTYWDARTDDARLVFEIVRAAHRFGAACANHVEAAGFDRTGSRATAVLATDRRRDAQLAVRARVIVNAAGVWAGEVAALDDAAAAPKLRPAKGIHLVVPGARLPLGTACIVPTAARDRRSLFAIPWGPNVVLGTTDTEYSGSLDSPAVDAAGVEYVLAGINKWFEAGLAPGDVVAGWAGLRPLAAGEAERTADLSRRHRIARSPSGVLTITGGKLTTYRRMARDAVDLACRELGIRERCRTSRIRIGISGVNPGALLEETQALALAMGLDPAVARHLVAGHGERAPGVLSLVGDDASLGAAVAPGLPTILAEVAWAFRSEMAQTLEDALSRRTRLALADAAGGLHDLEALAHASGLSRTQADEQARVYAGALARERGPVAPPPVRT